MAKKTQKAKTRSKPLPKATPTTELSGALRDMVKEAELSGGRDRPEVTQAREVLAKHATEHPQA